MTDNNNDKAWIASGARNKYHTNPDCRYVTDSHREVDREYAEVAYSICRHCSGEYTPHNKDSGSQGENAIQK